MNYTIAPANTPCGFRRCASEKNAVHVLTTTLPVAPAGTALCAYHSPYDVKETDVSHTVEVPIHDVVTISLALRERHIRLTKLSATSERLRESFASEIADLESAYKSITGHEMIQP